MSDVMAEWKTNSELGLSLKEKTMNMIPRSDVLVATYTYIVNRFEETESSIYRMLDGVPQWASSSITLDLYYPQTAIDLTLKDKNEAVEILEYLRDRIESEAYDDTLQEDLNILVLTEMFKGRLMDILAQYRHWY